MNLRTSYLLFFLLQSLSGLCQDIHFSQFNMSPLSLNPALTGFFDGNYRFAGNYRGQWAAVPVPYTTFSASADMNMRFSHRTKDKLGLGLFLYNDKAGDADFGTTNLGVSLSYIKPLGSPSSHQAISFGIQPGIDTFDPGASTGENFSNNNFAYYNISGGIHWYYRPDSRTSYELGAGLFNINSAGQSFFSKEDVRLFKRFTFHGNAQFKIGSKTDLLPAFQVMQQHNFTEVLLGTSVRFLLLGHNNEAFKAGAWLRVGDAFILSAGYDYKQFNFGVSYDINYSGLSAATNYRGGLELAVIYIIKNVPTYLNKRICPVYF
jgi:type IX secretion system PorP/SprF family membrane protein